VAANPRALPPDGAGGDLEFPAALQRLPDRSSRRLSFRMPARANWSKCAGAWCPTGIELKARDPAFASTCVSLPSTKRPSIRNAGFVRARQRESSLAARRSQREPNALSEPCSKKKTWTAQGCCNFWSGRGHGAADQPRAKLGADANLVMSPARGRISVSLCAHMAGTARGTDRIFDTTGSSRALYFTAKKPAIFASLCTPFVRGEGSFP
jgi:hypothetical protein